MRINKTVVIHDFDFQLASCAPKFSVPRTLFETIVDDI